MIVLAVSIGSFAVVFTCLGYYVMPGTWKTAVIEAEKHKKANPFASEP